MLTPPGARRRWPLVTGGAVVALVVGLLLGGHPGWMPGWVRGVFAPQQRSERQFDQILGLIEQNYYRPVDSTNLVNTSLQAAVASLGDPYSHYYPPGNLQQFQQETNPQVSGIGVEISPEKGGLMIEQVFPDSPASGAGLTDGDLIVAVDGHSIAHESVDAASNRIRGRTGTTVEITVRRGHTNRTVKMTRRSVVVPVSSAELVHYHGRKLGYLLFTQFTQGSAAQLSGDVKQMLHQGAQGLILDLRDNPGGLLSQAVAVASLFVPNGTIVTTRGRNQPTTVYDASGDPIAASIPMAVLVDRGTASSAEIVTSALQESGRAKVVGTRTYGKGVFQESETVDGGGELDITVGQFYTRNGTNLGAPSVVRGRTVARGPGIKPNLYVPDNPENPGPEALAAAERLLATEVK